MIQNTTSLQLKAWLDAGEAVLVDVREPAEFNAGHITGAVSLPLSGLTAEKLPAHAGKRLVFQCQSGRRSHMACDKVTALAVNADIYNLSGGIVAWKEAGLPVAGSGKSFLPLDRQVQLTIGLCLLISSAMIAAGHTSFFWLTGFLGAGLTFAGLTGFCGLAMVMARMPWNKGEAKASCCNTAK